MADLHPPTQLYGGKYGAWLTTTNPSASAATHVFLGILCGQSCRVWSYATGKCTTELHGHSHVIEALAWAPESARAAINEAVTGSADVRNIYTYICIYIYICGSVGGCVCACVCMPSHTASLSLHALRVLIISSDAHWSYDYYCPKPLHTATLSVVEVPPRRTAL